jgi:hypothetical protein
MRQDYQSRGADSMPLRQQIEVHSPEPKEESYAGPVEMHIVRKYGKFHGHVKMHDGAEHHLPPHATMHEAHAALLPHIAGEAHPGEEQVGPHDKEESASEPAQEDVNA